MEIICECGKHIPDLKEVKGKLHAFCKFCYRLYFITRSPFNRRNDDIQVGSPFSPK